MNWIKGSKESLEQYGINTDTSRQLVDGDYLTHFELTSNQWVKAKDDLSIEFVDESTLAEYTADELEPQTIAKMMIIKASRQCKQRILQGFDSECLGISKHFDSTMEDQATIQGLTLTSIIGLNGLATEETHWKGTRELECYKFEYVQMLKLAEDLKKHVEKNINQFNAERLAILNV